MIADDLVFDTLSETQTKLRILYLSSSVYKKDNRLVAEIKPSIIRIFLKVLSLTSLKEVLSGKVRHRLVFNYFKKVNHKSSTYSVLENNTLFLDSTYLFTVAINNLYLFPIEELQL